MGFLSVWAGFSKGLGSYLSPQSRLCFPRCPASRSSSVEHRWICHKGSTLFWKPLVTSEDTTCMGLASDLQLPLVGTHSTLAWRCWHSRAKKKRGLCWFGSLSKLSPGSERHHCWLRGGDGHWWLGKVWSTLCRRHIS